MKSLFHLCHFKGQGAGFDPSTMPSSVSRGHSGRYPRIEGPSFTLTDTTKCLFGIYDALQVKGQDSFVITSSGKPVVTVKFHDASVIPEYKVVPKEDVVPEGDATPEGEVVSEDESPFVIRCVFAGAEVSVVREAVSACLDLGNPTELIFHEGRGRNRKYLGATLSPFSP